jgi:cytochrome b subunit of formate dehydrogenase
MKLRNLLLILGLIFLVFVIASINTFFEYHVIVDKVDYEWLQNRAEEVTRQEEQDAKEWLSSQGFTIYPPETNLVIISPLTNLMSKRK